MLWRLALLIFVIDQLSKWAVVHGLELARVGVIEVLPPFLVFRMGWNTGINFGLFAGSEDSGPWILIGLALIIVAVVLWWVRGETDWRVRASAGVLVGGALGNVVDRVIYGAVADFLNMSCCGIQNPFVFNVADVAIFAGAIGLVIYMPNTPKDEPDAGA